MNELTVALGMFCVVVAGIGVIPLCRYWRARGCAHRGKHTVRGTFVLYEVIECQKCGWVEYAWHPLSDHRGTTECAMRFEEADEQQRRWLGR